MYNILHIIIPQGTVEEPKKEHLFVNFLELFHKTAQNESIALEIVGYQQYTSFFITCQPSMAKVIQGLIYSIFPECEIRNVQDYTNLYDPNKNTLKGTTLALTANDIYPFLDFENFAVDSLSGIFSVISKLERNEQIWIQLLIEPLAQNWSYYVSRKLKMKINKLRRTFSVKDALRLKNKKDFYINQDQSIIQKSEQEPFAMQVRIGSIASTHELAEKNLEALSRAYFQFNKTDANGFRKDKIKSRKSFLTEYQKRSFTHKNIVSSKEIATLYHFPNADHVSHVVHVLAKKHEAPKNLPTAHSKDISLFGMTNHHNNFQPFGIKQADRRRHLYVVGKSGVGKSKLLELLINADIQNGQGICVLDPHGDLVDNILRLIPKERIQDVIYFDPADTEYPIAFNPLEQVDEKYKMQITIGFIDIFKKLFGSNWSDRLEHVLRYTTLALLDSPNTTVLSILKLLSDKNYRQAIIARINDSVVKNFWVNEFAGWSEKFDSEAITPLLNKVGQLVSTNMVRNIIGQTVNTFNIRDIMDSQKILLMKVSKGLLGEENAQLIGSMIVTKIYQAAMSRADIREEDRKPFYFYVDEFQNFATDTFTEILSEARKYGLCMTIAHQYLGQLNEGIRKTVFGNIGSIINFRVGAEDAAMLEQEYTPIFSVRDIINLGVREFYLKMSIDGELAEPFSGRTLEMKFPAQDFNHEIIATSRQKYCTPRREVEAILQKWDEGATQELLNNRQHNSLQEHEPVFEIPIV